MIELHHPRQMPHAVPFEPPFDFYSSSSSSSSRSCKLQSQRPQTREMQLPIPNTTAGAYLNVPRNTTSRQSLTPLADMAVPNTGTGPVHTQKDMSYSSGYQYQLPAIGNSRNISSQENGQQQQQRPPVAAQEMGHRRKTSISPNLRVPPNIKTPQEGLPQLAAEITCLFWFENELTLKQVLSTDAQHLPIAPLVKDAIPSTGFRKWVTTILTTTQVAPNVILLALLFIFRLKQINPSVKGKPGSEYRLLTVALMLGNKFLDDNTYTNKTWAEVSGISVQEVHIMEVEFLSNMRYSLFTSKQQWDEWHTTLGKFGTFFDRAAKATLSPVVPPIPSMQTAMSCNPSPPRSQYPSPSTATAVHSPATTIGWSPASSATVGYSPAGPPQFVPSMAGSTSVSPIPELGPITQRKRSADHTADHPAKRLHGLAPGPYTTSMAIPALQAPVGRSFDHAPTLHRLPPLPSLTIPQYPQENHTPIQQVNWSELPPPNSQNPQNTLPPATRSMGSVYPTPGYFPPFDFRTPTNTTAPPFSVGNTPSAGDHSRQLSPYPVGSANSSPVSATFNTNLRQLSPSYFLAQRQSPYRPVRGVTTLLVPPPSTSMHNPASQIRHDQMQYQPIGRPTNERRVGTLPYNTWGDGYADMRDLLLPPPPQPNFHR